MNDLSRATRPLPAVTAGARLVLDLIARAEGTSGAARRRHGYASDHDVTFAYGRTEPPGRTLRLTEMSLAEVEALQRTMRGSSAAGRYQIIRATLDSLRRRYGLADAARFDAELQDRLGRALMGERGYDRFLAGEIGVEAMMDGLAREWASLPMANGASAYSYEGRPQPVALTRTQVRKAVEAARRLERGG